jgi:hypothetical protein
MNIVSRFAFAICQPDILAMVHIEQNRQHTPISSSLTISRPNSSACLRWNDVVHLVDLDMAITQAGLPLV